MDAHKYIHDIARLGGAEMEMGNLYIGGCSLERHMENVKSGLPAYEFFLNGVKQDVRAIDETLGSEKWDCVTLQQASHFSGKPETYEPYLTELAGHVRQLIPQAEVLIHETWAYEYNSTHSAFPEYHCDRFYMHECLKRAYTAAAARLGARLIPVGDAVAKARENPLFDPEKGGVAITRDGFHLSYTMGRFLAGAVWYEFFTGKDIRVNPFVPPRAEYPERTEERPTDQYMDLLRKIAHETVNQ